jgi:hypothetical protein
LEISHTLFGERILEVSIDSTVGQGLGIVPDMVDENFVSEASIVAVVVLDGDTMRLGIVSFERSLG